jgi:hypothetical protein
MSKLENAVKGISEIKTDFYTPENSKELLFTLGVLLKTIFPLVTVVVHKGTMQLIANGHYLQLALQEGKEEIEVVLADFPEEYLLHAIATHWKPTKKYALMFKFIAVFMKYYTKKNGIGAQFRDVENPISLRELVAEILGTNRTYLDMIEAIGNFNPELLEQVDNGEVSLKEAFKMLPREKKLGEMGKEKKEQKKNYSVPVTDLSGLSKDELVTLTTNLPSFHAEQIGNGILPNELSISKSFTNNDFFQGFSIVYEKDGKSVVINIVYTDDFRSSLMAA